MNLVKALLIRPVINTLKVATSDWPENFSLFLFLTISYPESSGFLVSGATPGRLWGHRKNSIFLIGCSATVSIVLPQKSCGDKIRCPQSLPGVAPLTKKPEDSGYEIDFLTNGKNGSIASLSCLLMRGCLEQKLTKLMVFKVDFHTLT